MRRLEHIVTLSRCSVVPTATDVQYCLLIPAAKHHPHTALPCRPTPLTLHGCPRTTLWE